MRKILVAVDGSETSDRAVEEAVVLAKELEAELEFVSVFAPPRSALGNPYYDRSLQYSLHHARLAVASALVKASEAGIEADGEVLEGQPAEEILHLAEQRAVDHIVIGSRGRGRIASAILGSVSSEVVRSARCPVVVVSEKAAAGVLSQS
jgi:nucleotide-binding universal stress UspA family protein